MIALAYARTFAMPVCVTRCSNNYGPYQFPEKLIPLVINNILEGRAIPVYGAGENVRDWLHVDDHVRAIEAVRLGGADGAISTSCDVLSTQFAVLSKATHVTVNLLPYRLRRWITT